VIVYKKLGKILEEKNLLWRALSTEGGLSPNMPTKLAHDRLVNSDTINKVCEYLKVQPGDIMEWIPDAEYEEKKQNADKLALEKQIAELQARLKELNK
jgi:DNA-binding Xre family transcriptional regulator